MIAFSFFFVFCLFSLTLSSSVKKEVDAEELNVHIIAHTHDDVGWLKTVDQYYLGSNESIQYAAVQYIIDTVVEQLVKNPSRRFIYVEIAFFMRWWREQTSDTQATVKQLVKEGRLEFINGGWCMNDEAATHFQSVVEQMTIGHRFLLENFGVIPTIGWHIDPFGHANTQASLFSQMGFNGFFFARIDYQDKEQRDANKELEMIWRPSQSLGDSVDMFTHVLDDGYGYPADFDFEGGSPPIQDDPNLFDMNVKERADEFANQMRQRSGYFKHNELMVTFGTDFQYVNADINFKNMDKLMKYINEHKEDYNLNMFYSTPSIYVKAVNQKNLTWAVKTDDFFPYADNSHSYWTGYFTSRPALKYYIRFSQSFLNFGEKMASALPYASLTEDIKQGLYSLQEPIGVTQHHDSITGTSKQHVAFDYAKRLYIGYEGVLKNTLRPVIGNLLMKAGKTGNPFLDYCPLMNVSQCEYTDGLSNLGDGDVLPVVLGNSFNWARKEHIKLPVPSGVSLFVYDTTGNTIPSEVHVIQGKSFLYFQATIPQLGFSVYFIGKGSNKPISPAEGTSIENDMLSLKFQNGVLSSITDKSSGTTINVSQKFFKYNPVTGENNSGQPSGAYIFRPIGTAEDLPLPKSVQVTNGSLVQTASQTFNNWISQTFVLHEGSNVIEVDSSVGEIDISDGLGKEIVSRYSTDLSTDSTWFTDSQGDELQERKLNYRPTWNLTVTEPVAGNFYPVNAAISLKDKAKGIQFTWVLDRSRSGSSLKNGEVETMIHRRLLHDDHRGVGEPLNETTQVKVNDYLMLTKTADTAKTWRSRHQKSMNPVQVLFSKPTTIKDWMNDFNTEYSLLTKDTPPNLYIQTFRPITYPMTDNKDYLIRFHHLYAVGEDANLSKPVTIELDGLFTGRNVVSLTELNLSGSVDKSSIHRYKWNTATKQPSQFSPYDPEELKANTVTVNPMDYRTFYIQFDK